MQIFKIVNNFVSRYIAYRECTWKE